MQYNKADYNPAEHDDYLAIFMRQPFAHDLSIGYKSIEVRDDYTTYRGDVLICSTPKYSYRNMEGGATIGLAELYDIKPVAELTREEWKKTRVPFFTWKTLKHGYAWLFRNQRRVIEMPINKKARGHLCHVYYTNDMINPYPRYMLYDRYNISPLNKKRGYINK
jgi:hypothetical protein